MKIWNRAFPLLLMVFALFLLIPKFVSASIITGTCGENLTYSYDEATGTLSIAGQGEMDTGEHSIFNSLRKKTTKIIIEEGVTSISNGAFSHFQSLKTVSLPNSMRSIGSTAFLYCTSLAEFPAHNGITKIGERAFECCDSLEEIVIPTGVTKIQNSAFNSCHNLKNLVLHDNLKVIEGYAFSDCVNLTKVVIPDSVTSVDHSAFHGCKKLSDVKLGNRVQKISNHAFSGCDALTEFTIPDSVTEIASYAFTSCKNLKTIHIGSGVASIAKNAFETCPSLDTVTVSSSNPHISTDRSVIYNKEKTTLLLCPQGFSGNYSILPGTKVIEAYAFYGCEKLTGITIPAGIKTIPQYGFCACTGLQSVSLPDGLTTIKLYGFARCSSLPEIRFPSSLSKIESLAFSNCKNIKTMYFSGMAPMIKDDCFNGVNATAYYPANKPAWDVSIKPYGGKIEWISISCNGNHKAVTDAAKDATCTESGLTEGSHCSVCGEVLTAQKKIFAKGHSFGSWTTVVEATQQEEGSAKRTCLMCGFEENKALRKLSSNTGEQSNPVATTPEETVDAPTQEQDTTATKGTATNEEPETTYTASDDPANRKSPKDIPWNWITIGSIVLLATGIAVTFTVMKKKKR